MKVWRKLQLQSKKQWWSASGLCLQRERDPWWGEINLIDFLYSRGLYLDASHCDSSSWLLTWNETESESLTSAKHTLISRLGGKDINEELLHMSTFSKPLHQTCNEHQPVSQRGEHDVCQEVGNKGRRSCLRRLFKHPPNQTYLFCLCLNAVLHTRLSFIVQWSVGTVRPLSNQNLKNSFALRKSQSTLRAKAPNNQSVHEITAAVTRLCRNTGTIALTLWAPSMEAM